MCVIVVSEAWTLRTAMSPSGGEAAEHSQDEVGVLGAAGPRGGDGLGGTRQLPRLVVVRGPRIGLRDGRKRGVRRDDLLGGAPDDIGDGRIP
ncbi:hypothetical protein ACWD26_09895 [Streptomyces sp. NPDC002787]